MPDIDDGALKSHMPVRQHRIGRIPLVEGKQLFASRHRHGMIVLRPTLRDHQVVVVADVVEVGRLRRFGPAERAVPDRIGFPRHFKILYVVFRQPDSAFHDAGAVVPDISRSHDIALPVVVEEDGRVNPGDVVKIVNLRPGSCRVLCRHDKIAPVREIGIDDVEGAV